MPQQLPSGRFRGRVRHPRTGKQINPRAVIGGPETYETYAECKAAEDETRRLLRENARVGVTVAEFWHDWTTDPLWLRPSRSTQIHYRERTAKFVVQHGHLPLRAIGDEHVAAWIKGGQNLGTLKELRAFFNDAASPAAGRLVSLNPFAKLGIRESRGRRDTVPPDEAARAGLIAYADELTPPSFAGYLDFASHEGMRPGEVDALRWTKIDFQAKTVTIDEQWNVKSREFTLPKHNVVRVVALTEPAEERLLRLPRESEFVFTTLRGTHYRPTSRIHHWNRVRAAAGLGNVDLYTCTRHYFGWYAWNVLELDSRDIALHFGHQDGGELVRKTYGHADAKRARVRILEAFRTAPAAPIPIRRTA